MTEICANAHQNGAQRSILSGSFVLCSRHIYGQRLDKLLLYWIVPLVTVFQYTQLAEELRGKHLGNLEYDHPLLIMSRSMKISKMAGGIFYFIAAPALNYHLEHHLYPHYPLL